MNPRLASYVIKHYAKFMTQRERRAHLHLMGTMKATGGRSDVVAQQDVKREKGQRPWLSDDPEVLRLASEGMESFADRTATRILEDHRDAIFLNYCSRCGELTRTPTARQCRFCGHDWHSLTVMQSSRS